MAEDAFSAADLRRFVGVESPTRDHTSLVLGKLQLPTNRLSEPDGETFNQWEQPQDARCLLIMEGQPAPALFVQLLLAEGKVVAEERRVVSRYPVEEQTSLPREVFGAPPLLCSIFASSKHFCQRNHWHEKQNYRAGWLRIMMVIVTLGGLAVPLHSMAWAKKRTR